MTQIHFYHGTQDRLKSTAAWLFAAWEEGRRVLVYSPDTSIAEQLDDLLWTQPATGFVPHCRANSPLAGETPILIAQSLEDVGELPQDDYLLNLADGIPPGFARFQNLIEIVSIDDAVRLPARQRFKFYRERGYEIQSRDLGT